MRFDDLGNLQESFFVQTRLNFGIRDEENFGGDGIAFVMQTSVLKWCVVLDDCGGLEGGSVRNYKVY